MRSILFLGAPLLLTGCLAMGRQPLPPPPSLEEVEVAQEPEPEPFPVDRVWTGRADLDLQLAASRTLVAVPHILTRLDVVGRDSIGLLVRCMGCPHSIEGHVREDDVVFTHLPPEISAWSDLTEFVLSIRDAAARRDLGLLRPVMAPDFFFAFVGPQTPDGAFAVWRAEQFATLGRLPALLDRGLASSDGVIWSAPPDFVHDISYRGLRAGFRQRVDGRWEWLYLVQGISSN